MSDSTQNLDTIQQSQAQKEVTANALFDAASPATLFGRRASTSAALTWGFYGGRRNGSSVANGTVALTDNATNYIVVDRSSGTVSAATTSTNWNNVAAYGRAYKVVTASGSMTSWEDHRFSDDGSGILNFGAAARPVVVKTANYTITAADLVVIADATSGNVTLTLPAANAAGAGLSRLYRVKRKDSSANTVSIARAGSDTIDGGTSFALGGLQSVDLESDGSSAWYSL